MTLNDQMVLHYFQTIYDDLPASEYRKKGISDVEYGDLMWMIINAPIPEKWEGEFQPDRFFDRCLKIMGDGEAWGAGKLIQWWLKQLTREGLL